MNRYATHRALRHFPLLLLISFLIISGQACSKRSSSNSGSGSAGTGTDAGGGTTSGPMSSLQGTAMSIDALAGAAVTARDAEGHMAYAVTDAGGAFAVTVDGFSSPVLLKVTTAQNLTLFGIAFQSGTANVHPFMDLLVRNWYRVKGFDIKSEFDQTAAILTPAAADIDSAKEGIRFFLSPWLKACGVDPADFDLSTTPFSAGAGGFSAVLRVVRVSDEGTRSIIYPFDAINKTKGDSFLVLPSAADIGVALQGARSGIGELLATWRGVVNSKGALITANDLLAFYSTLYINNGRNALQDIAGTIALLSSRSISTVPVRDGFFFNGENSTAGVKWRISLTSGSAFSVPSAIVPYQSASFVYDKNMGRWLFYGNQRAVEMRFRTGLRKEVTAAAPSQPTVSPIIDSIITAPTGSVSYVYVAGPGLNNTAVFFTKKAAGGQDTFSFPANQVLTSAPPPGSLYEIRIKLTDATGSIVPLQEAVVVQSAGTFTLFAPSGHTLTDAKLGSALGVAWTLPGFTGTATTVDGWARDVIPQTYTAPTITLGAPATSATITIPHTLGTPDQAWLKIGIEGENGEYAEVRHEFR